MEQNCVFTVLFNPKEKLITHYYTHITVFNVMKNLYLLFLDYIMQMIIHRNTEIIIII